MKRIEVSIPEAPSEPTRRPLLKRVTPLGWVSVVVVGVFMISVVALLGKTLAGCSASLDDLPTVPPITPKPATPTATSLFPTATPTPEGWTVKRHPLTGEEYLSPPRDDEAMIRDAFDAVRGCDLLIDDDPPHAMANYDRPAALQRFAAASDMPDRNCSSIVVIIPTASWGPADAVYCQDHVTCVLSRAKAGPASAILSFNEDVCLQESASELPCLVSPVGDQDPYVAYVATVQHGEDGQWTVVDLKSVPLSDLGTSSLD